MKKKYLTIAAFLLVPGVAYANGAFIEPNTYLFADQEIFVGGCRVEGFNPAPGLVCVHCSLTQFDSLSLDGQWCGGKVKWDSGYINEDGEIITITTNTKGNPVPGKFPYKGEFTTYSNGENGLANFDGCPMFYPTDNLSVCKDASDVCEPGAIGPVVVAIHADVYSYDGSMEETAWAAEYLLDEDGEPYWGTEFPGRNWATYVHVPCNTGLAGICEDGLLTCGGAGAVCVSIQNEVETCDGADNDCDGDVDEGFPGLGQNCDVGEGECKEDGQNVCNADGDGIECNATPGTPSPEICDDLDNDCDGDVDEDFEDLGDSCVVGTGACEATGEIVCSADGSGEECDAIEGTPSPEICTGGLDEDCDGFTDAADPDCNVIDADGDGSSPPEDCDDNNPAIYPGAFECNPIVWNEYGGYWTGGYRNYVDNDCDGDPDDSGEGCYQEGCPTTGDCQGILVCSQSQYGYCEYPGGGGG